MDRLLRLARTLSRAGLWFGGILVLLAALLIGVDVTPRKVLDASIGGADELAGYALAIGTAWSLGAALLERAHIRIDSLYGLFPRRLRLALDFAGVALLCTFFALVGRHGWSMVQQSWVSSSRSQSALTTPTVLPQSIWLAGIVLFVAVGVALLLYAAARLARGDPGAAENAISTRSAAEELRNEVRDLEKRKAAGTGRP